MRMQSSFNTLVLSIIYVIISIMYVRVLFYTQTELQPSTGDFEVEFSPNGPNLRSKRRRKIYARANASEYPS